MSSLIAFLPTHDCIQIRSPYWFRNALSTWSPHQVLDMKHMNPGLLSILFAILAVNAGAERPNLVVLFADDMGYSDIGCFGKDSIVRLLT